MRVRVYGKNVWGMMACSLVGGVLSFTTLAMDFAHVLKPDGIQLDGEPAGNRVSIRDDGSVFLHGGNASWVKLSWESSFGGAARTLGGMWERTYGDSGWTALSATNRVRGGTMPWYFLVTDGTRTDGYGVRVQPNAFASWKAFPDRLELTLDVRAGVDPVELGSRTLELCRLVSRKGSVGERAFAAGRAFCRMMCPQSRLPKEPVYGYNDWYCAYGNNTATNFLADVRHLVNLMDAQPGPKIVNRPFAVVDDGWQCSRFRGGDPRADGEQWGRSRPKWDMAMDEFARRVKALGARPGLWYRPLYPDAGKGEQPIDPTDPKWARRIRSEMRQFADWGMELVKIDFITYDWNFTWGYELEESPVKKLKKSWRDRTRTTAEVVCGLYRVMREAAGDNMYIIGCNAIDHFAAGLFELQRIGDDTSGKEWERTRKMGPNTMGMRAIQDGIFYSNDGDCVGLVKKGDVPWHLNRQWLDLVSRSGTALFISWKRSLATDPDVARALGMAFRRASMRVPTAEPLDWQDTLRPAKWRFGDGTIGDYDWDVEKLAGSAPDWQAAKPTWPKGRTQEKNLSVGFRASFVWDGAGQPVLRLTGSSVYRAKLNGAFVGHGPARTAGGWFRVDEWPLAATSGVNTIELDVAGYNTHSMQYVDQPAFIQAEVVDGTRVLAATPQAFTARELPRAKTGPVYSRQRGFAVEAWTLGGPEAPALELAATPPVLYLPREVPYPDTSINAAFGLAADGDGRSLYALPAIDTGFVGVRVVCTQPGRLVIQFDEALTNGKLDLFRNGNPSNSWHAMMNRIAWDFLKPGVYDVETFEPYTMKYVRAWMESGTAQISAPHLRRLRNRAALKASFSCSDPLVEKILAAACASFAQNAVDVYTDCPSRERSGWLCDTWFTSHTGAWLTGDCAIEKCYLENFARLGLKDPMPSQFPGNSMLPTWTMWYILQCGEYAARAGKDAESFKRFVKARVEGNVAFLAKSENADGLLEDLPGWVFVEWSHANQLVKGVNYPVNMLWAATLDCVDRLYGRSDLAAKAARVRAKVREQSFDGTWFHDQALREKDGTLKLVPDRTETCQYYAFFFGTATPQTHAALWRMMTEEFGPDLKKHPDIFPSDMFFGRLLRLDLLGKAGRADTVVREIKGYLGRMAEESGTLWEFADGHDSRCHAFTSYAFVLMCRDVLGIAELDHVGRRVVLREPTASLTQCAATLPVADGLVRISWRRTDGKLIREDAVPANWRVITAVP